MATPPNIFAPLQGNTNGYIYGQNLGANDYSIWGSRGNPYLIKGNIYNPSPVDLNPATPAPQPSATSDDSFPGGDGSDSSNPNYDPYVSSFNMSNTMDDSLFGKVPGVLSGFALYNAGINPLNNWFGYGDRYNENYTGSGSAVVNAYGITPGQQMDMLIEQEKGMWDNPYEQDLFYTGSAAINPDEYEASKEYGWGSDQHLASIEKTFADLDDPVNEELAALSGGLTTTTTNGLNNFTVDPTLQQQYDIARGQQMAAQTIADTQGGGPAGTVTMSDGSTVGSLSDMEAGTSGSYSSADSGNVGVTSYGGGQFGFTDANGEEVGYEDPGGETGGGDSDGGGGGSYIATATTQALGEEGLKVFEDWRDYMFNALPTFTSSFGRYRVTAPKIVEEIDKKENSKEIYKGIWDKYLKPIFDIIKTDTDSKKALKDYKVMVRELSNKYLKGVSDGK